MIHEKAIASETASGSLESVYEESWELDSAVINVCGPRWAFLRVQSSLPNIVVSAFLHASCARVLIVVPKDAQTSSRLRVAIFSRCCMLKRLVLSVPEGNGRHNKISPEDRHV